jgi:hypothetical protein
MLRGRVRLVGVAAGALAAIAAVSPMYADSTLTVTITGSGGLFNGLPGLPGLLGGLLGLVGGLLGGLGGL